MVDICDRKDKSSEPRTVRQLAEAKALPERFLVAQGLADLPGGGISIEYMDIDGLPLFKRKRGVPGGPRFQQPAGVQLQPYGLWRLANLNAEGVLHLTEGESDALTLWHHGCDALGLPSAHAAGALELSHLAGVVELYVLPDADDAGRQFADGVAERLVALGFTGRAFVAQLPVGCKDICDLHRRDPDHFREHFELLVKFAKPIDIVLKRANQNGRAGARLSVTKKPPDDPGSEDDQQDLPRLLTDVGNGRRLAAWHGERLRHVHPWRKWLCWDTARWRMESDGQADRAAKDTARRMMMDALEEAKRIQQELSGESHDDDRRAGRDAQEATGGVEEANRMGHQKRTRQPNPCRAGHGQE